ncbi:MAG: alpha/beta hydrolase [Bacteroidota bacterium]
MKIRTNLIAILIFATLVFTGCDQDDDDDTMIMTPVEEPTLEFDLSDSPIDLQGIPASFAEDIPYDDKERTKFDIWMPESSTPTGLVVYIHGGGFTGGDKTMVRSDNVGRDWLFTQDVRTFLENNVAIASINYTLLEPFGEEEEGVIKPLIDCQRAIQFMKYYASSFNIDEDKIVLSGNSAGGGASLWLAFNDDAADPDNADPVLQESTRVIGAAVREIQSSYDVEGRWFNQVFEDFPDATFELYRQLSGGNLLQFYGLLTDASYDTEAIVAYRQEVDMLGLMSTDDPPIWVTNIVREAIEPTTGDLVLHHPFHARELREKADMIGLENVIAYGNGDNFVPDPNRPDETWVEFSIRMIEQ